MKTKLFFLLVIATFGFDPRLLAGKPNAQDREKMDADARIDSEAIMVALAFDARVAHRGETATYLVPCNVVGTKQIQFLKSVSAFEIQSRKSSLVPSHGKSCVVDILRRHCRGETVDVVVSLDRSPGKRDLFKVFFRKQGDGWSLESLILNDALTPTDSGASQRISEAELARRADASALKAAALFFLEQVRGKEQTTFVVSRELFDVMKPLMTNRELITICRDGDCQASEESRFSTRVSQRVFWDGRASISIWFASGPYESANIEIELSRKGDAWMVDSTTMGSQV